MKKIASDEIKGSIDQSPETLAGGCTVTLEDPEVVVTPPLTLAPVDGPTLVAGFVPAVDDDDAAPFCNADVKLPYLAIAHRKLPHIALRQTVQHVHISMSVSH
ncbi:hypothetical protein Baya_3099 [Bagarius yarrelli]|uniref:Uncharacterized protein n=1 Tax=Bagarius yarrelli TaxID=175774 RepID=A0A556TUF9_BAGYA|nr:hypothetical protein Baya_3099 [Bagarius yarrelli]